MRRLGIGLGKVHGRCHSRGARTPVRFVAKHIGAGRDVLRGTRIQSVSLAELRRSMRSVTKLQVVYRFMRSVRRIIHLLHTEGSFGVVVRQSCVARGGRDNCHSCRVIVRCPIRHVCRRGGVLIRVRVEALTVGF